MSAADRRCTTHLGEGARCSRCGAGVEAHDALVVNRMMTLAEIRQFFGENAARRAERVLAPTLSGSHRTKGY